MGLLGGWFGSALALADRIPVLDQLKSGMRRGIVAGALAGALLAFLAGAIAGAVNRGLPGMFVGGASVAAIGLAAGALVGAFVGPLLIHDYDSANVSIRIEGTGDADGFGQAFYPGDEVRGQVLVTAKHTIRVQDAEILFLCRAFRTYDELGPEADATPRVVRETLPRHEAHAGVPAGPRLIRRGTTSRYPFEFRLPPDALPTHHGNICVIRWTVHAYLQAARMPALRAHQEVLVSAIEPETHTLTGEYRAMTSSEACQLMLSLPRAVFNPGETVRARLRLTPKQSFAVDEIRAVLLRVEHVPAGDSHVVYVAEVNVATGVFRGERRNGDASSRDAGTSYVWLEGEVDLAGRTAVRSGEALNYSFSLEIPDYWQPSLSTSAGSVAWKLGVLVARPAQPDLRVFHELLVHTSRALGRQAAAPPEPPARVRRISAFQLPADAGRSPRLDLFWL